ncbi:MAG: hypothetical protein ACI9XO_000166 [Paraglaciecola sp.]|jgi:hypothetical protein
MRIQKYYIITLMMGLLFSSCWKEKTVKITDNQPPIVNNVPAIKIENYVNRIFIDLLGREPLDPEMAAEVATLRQADLSTESREALILKLQVDTNFIEGDTSYQRAYYQHLYDLAKIRTLEGVSEAQIVQFLSTADFLEDSIRLMNIYQSRTDMQQGNITIEKMFGRMIYNDIYDAINMNTTNFVNASFDNLFWRYPTQTEFQAGFNMVEFSISETFLGETGTNRQDYVDIFINSREMFEGLIIWVYQQALQRRPTTEETFVLLEDFYNNRDIREMQKVVMVTDEYANF